MLFEKVSEEVHSLKVCLPATTIDIGNKNWNIVTIIGFNLIAH